MKKRRRFRRKKKNAREDPPRTRWGGEGWKKIGNDFSYLPSFCLTLLGSLVTRASERTKRVRRTQLVGVTIFVANSRKNDRPNKSLAYAVKKSESGIGSGEMGIEKKEWRSNGIAAGQRGRRREGEISQLGASLVKLTGRYYGTGVKNERDIKKDIIPGSFVRPRDRGRRVSHLMKAKEKKREEKYRARSNYSGGHGRSKYRGAIMITVAA